jgi:hypothetical protein
MIPAQQGPPGRASERIGARPGPALSLRLPGWRDARPASRGTGRGAARQTARQELPHPASRLARAPLRTQSPGPGPPAAATCESPRQVAARYNTTRRLSAGQAASIVGDIPGLGPGDWPWPPQADCCAAAPRTVRATAHEAIRCSWAGRGGPGGRCGPLRQLFFPPAGAKPGQRARAASPGRWI